MAYRKPGLALQAAVLLISYVLGSIPSGFLIARIAGVEDIRRHGSGNIGATNVLRTLGWSHAVLVLVLDVAKGALAALLARATGAGRTGQALSGLAAMAGHLWPCTLGFRGGRGVATSLGLMLVIDPLVALAGASLFGLVVATTRFVSLGSLVAVLAAVVGEALRGRPVQQVLLLGLGASVIIWRHRPNIQRLLQGTEHRLNLQGRTPTAAAASAIDPHPPSPPLPISGSGGS